MVKRRMIFLVLCFGLMLDFVTSARAADDTPFDIIDITPETVDVFRGVGLPTGETNPRYEAFVIADASEDGFSGKVLTYQIPELMDAHPHVLRAWYVHMTLAYRATQEGVIPSTQCLAKQHALWKNMSALVARHGAPFPEIGQYDGVTDPDGYLHCVNDYSHDLVVEQGAKGGELLSRVGAQGIPTVVLIDNSVPGKAVIVQGAQPMQVFEDAFATLQKEEYKKLSTENISVGIEPEIRASEVTPAHESFFQYLTRTVSDWFARLFHR